MIRDKEAERLAQARDLELREIEQAGRHLEEESRQLVATRAALLPDELVVAGAARLPDLRKQMEMAKAEHGMLDGRRAGLEEGQEKLAEGSCPFLQETCRNIAGRGAAGPVSGKTGGPGPADAAACRSHP